MAAGSAFAPVTQSGQQALKQQYGLDHVEALSIRPWGDPRFSKAQRLGHALYPTVLASQSLADGLVTIHVTRPMTEWSRLTYEKWGFFVLISAVGGLLVVTILGMILYDINQKYRGISASSPSNAKISNSSSVTYWRVASCVAARITAGAASAW